MLQNSLGSPVEALVRSASRRRHGLLVLEQLSYALTIVLGGAILLLLLGTQILDWYWLVLLALAGLTIGAVRLRGRLLPYYQVAQILDRRLQLSDTLSTAWFVLTTPSSSGSQRRLQVKQAEEVAAGVQPQAAFPFEGKRAWTISALLLVIACGLFGVRYFAYDQLTFQQTLIPIRFGSVLEQFEARFLPSGKRVQEAHARPKTENGSTLQENRSASKNNAPTRHDGADLDKEAGSSRERRQANHQLTGNTHENSTKQEAQSRNNLASESASPTQAAPPQRASVNNTGNKNGREQTAKGSSEDRSLTSKLRDALSGLLAKMQGGSQQQPSGEVNQPPGPNQDRNRAASTNSQQSTSENTASKAADASSLQAQQQARNAERASTSRSQGSGDSSGHRSSNTHSAAGRQDGSKDARAAEQLKAMGKLAEIIGKRSASVTGEMTVETPSGKQQLQTDYTHKSGRHSGMGSEIDHNEVPVEDQQYVKEYMKQVHNPPETR